MCTVIRAGLLSAALLVVGSGCLKNAERTAVFGASGTFTDKRDGKKYKTVKIGGKRWMAENLNYETYDSWCYDNDDSNCERYGRLYDWYMAMTVCPAGWHLSTDQELNALMTATGGDSTDDTRLRSKDGWDKPTENCNGGECPKWVPGKDEFGYSALPGGYRTPDGDFENAGYYGYWWLAPHGDCDVRLQPIKYYKGKIVERRKYSSNDSYSVRCVQNDGDGGGSKCNPSDVPCPTDYALERRKELGENVEKLSEYFTDSRDDKTYRTVKIGGMTWMAENLNYAAKSGNSWCFSNNDCNCGVFGRLYDGETAKTICPNGWHLPSRDEWDSLARAVGVSVRRINGNESETGDPDWSASVDVLRSETGWDTRFPVRWKDVYGFSATPNGNRESNGDFSALYGDGRAQWWTATKYDADKYVLMSIGYYGVYMDEYAANKRDGWPVRCVANKNNAR